MVFGIGEGKISILLEKTVFSPGEPIRGKVVLSLQAPKKAKEIRLEVQTLKHRGRQIGEKTISFNKQLAGEKTYGSGETYEFEAIAPNDPTTQITDMGGNKFQGASFGNQVTQVLLYVIFDAGFFGSMANMAAIEIRVPAQPQ